MAVTGRSTAATARSRAAFRAARQLRKGRGIVEGEHLRLAFRRLCPSSIRSVSARVPFACQVGTSFADVVALSFLVDNTHRTVSLTATLLAEAFNGADVDFGSTGRLMLSLPSGLGFTSASGLLLTMPVTPVPEPSTLLLLIAGLGILESARRRARHTSPTSTGSLAVAR